MSRSTRGYSTLCTSPDVDDEHNLLDRRRTSSCLPNWQHRLGSWPMLICLLCTVLNALLTFVPLTSTPTPPTLITRQTLRTLRRPSQFIRFDSIPRPSPFPDKSFKNFAIVVGQINATEPRWVGDAGGVRGNYMVHGGTIAPDTRYGKVSESVSTVVQFRAIDWGMEKCELRLELPIGGVGKGGTLGIWRLNTTVELDALTLSYSTRPKRVTKLVNLKMGGEGVTWSRMVGCVMEEVLTYEIGCVEGPCAVEWEQDREDDTQGLYIVQHATA